MGHIKMGMFNTMLAWIAILTTVAVNPWFAFDPINLPKMLVISTGSFFLTCLLLSNPISIKKKDLLFLLCSLFLLLILVLSYFSNESPWYQQFWGTWGRSTGLLTYFSFVFLMVCAYLLATGDSLRQLRISFDRLGYFMSFYVLIQFLEIDPINWSQKLMIGTLGNLNFMSSFLGLTSISYTSRIILERLNASAKLFYFFLIALNLILILVSESIQGIGVYSAGLVILLAFYIRKKNSIMKALSFVLVSLSLGTLVLFGTAGVGPFRFLVQSTVLFRIDYWQSGVNMLGAHPLNGVGIDSYGDFYREFRTLEAVERTGPQRVTNTAHNIFLDVSTGSGMFAGLAFAFLVFLTMKSIFRGLKDRISSSDFQAFSAMCLGFFIFCLISINQIGVGVWGFIFMGLVNGFTSRIQLDSNHERKAQNLVSGKSKAAGKFTIREERSLSTQNPLKGPLNWVTSGLVSLVIFVLALLPNLADARFLAAVRSSDLNRAIDLMPEPGIQDFHFEQLMTKLSELGRDSDALELALVLSKNNPRNWQAWVQIAKSPVASLEQRKNAAANLLRLDPKNKLVRAELASELLP